MAEAINTAPPVDVIVSIGGEECKAREGRGDDPEAG